MAGWSTRLGLLAAALVFSSLAGCVASVSDGGADESVLDRDDAVSSNVPLRFDLATLDCASDDPSETCPANDDKCLCAPEVDALNYASPHFVAVGTDRNKAAINAAGNYQAAYINSLNSGWQGKSGAAWADDLMGKLGASFPKGIPKWLFFNEISAGLWPDNQSYRTFVVDVAARLNGVHHKKVIIAAPFAHPGKNAASWTALSKSAYVAAEVYLTGAAVNASGNSASWCEAQYRASKDAYTRLGVPEDRLMLVEHFGNTVKGVAWGRAGVGDAGWRNAIHARAEGARRVGFAGFLSYSWGSNQMHDTEADRLSYIDAYADEVLP